MMADPFEIARQSTLLEVQQTGTEVQQTVNKSNSTIGDIGDPAGENSVVALSKNIKKSVDSLAGQKPEILLPSDNLKIDVLTKQIDLPKGQTMFLGYLYFNKPGIVKFVSYLKAKTSESSGAMVHLLSFGDYRSLASGYPDYSQAGDIVADMDYPRPFFTACEVGKVVGTAYKTVTMFAKVNAGLYGIGLHGYYAGAVCNSIKMYYDVVGVEKYVTKI